MKCWSEIGEDAWFCPRMFLFKILCWLGKLQMSWTCWLLPYASHEQVFQAQVRMKPLTLLPDASCYFGIRLKGWGSLCLVSAWSSDGRKGALSWSSAPAVKLELASKMKMGLLLNGWLSHPKNLMGGIRTFAYKAVFLLDHLNLRHLSSSKFCSVVATDDTASSVFWPCLVQPEFTLPNILSVFFGVYSFLIGFIKACS